MMDIINILRLASPSYNMTRKEIYNTMMQSGKYRTYLSNNRYHNILLNMSRRGFITLEDDKVVLNPQLISMPENEIMALVSMPHPWPQDIIDGLI